MDLIHQMLNDHTFREVCGVGIGITVLLAIGAILDWRNKK